MCMNADTSLFDRTLEGRFNGAVLVRHAGRTLISRGYGQADRGHGRPNTPQTAFQIASISKQFAAAAILLLQESGALSVHDQLCTWLPDAPEKWQPITVHHLLTHTSGIPHWETVFPDFRGLYEPIERERLIRIFQSEPLKFPPGSGWAYSSPGYVLLGHIVEQVSGEPYASF